MKIETVKAISDNVVEIIDLEGDKFLLNLKHWMNLPILNYQELQDPTYFKLVRVAKRSRHRTRGFREILCANRLRKGK